MTWTFDSETLTISGTGSMTDFGFGDAAWRSYRNLITSIEISDGVTSIGNCAFWGCAKLLTINLPPSLISIGEDSFYDCKSLRSIAIPEGVESIGMTAFSNCKSLTSIRIPSSLTSLGFNPFGSCHNLTEINVDPSNQYFESIDGVLFNKTVNNLIAYPGGKVGSYVIPSSVVSINSNAFWGCQGITSISIPPNVTLIKSGTFWGCSNLARVYLPKTLQSIGSYAFEGCMNLASIIIPSNVTSIGNDAFSGCRNLSSVSYQGLYDPGPSSNRVFQNCEALNVICVPESYNSTTFCGNNISCRSSFCGNQCFDVMIEEDKCVVHKKTSMQQWEDQSNGCVEYFCDNESGLLAKSNCDNMCMNDTCIDENELVGKNWKVVIILASTSMTQFTYDEIVTELSELTQIDMNNMTVTIEYDENGSMERIVIYTDDELKAKKLAESLNELEGSDNCEGFSCYIREVTTIQKNTPLLSLSTGNYHHDILTFFMTMAFIFHFIR